MDKARLRGAATASEVSSAMSARVVWVETERQWWSAPLFPRGESDEHLHARVEATMAALHASPAAVLIVVGHSHFFRAMFAACLHPDLARSSPSLAHRLCKAKVPNCGVVCGELDFRQSPQPIVAAHCWSPGVGTGGGGPKPKAHLPGHRKRSWRFGHGVRVAPG
mmetsp:Transcript_53033/g.118999  ORF Transcript_53033/g.118999 Transcript_53033/m.118999 type:complete len:165 (-) Transcript_53033:341-835(-)